MNLFLGIILSIMGSLLLRSVSIVFVGGMAVNVLNYFFHFLAGKLLIPTQFGLLESLISFNTIFNVFVSTYSLILIDRIASIPKNQIYVFAKTKLKQVLIIFFSLVVLFSPVYPLFKTFFQLESFTSYFIFLLQLFSPIVLTVFSSTLQAKLKFGRLSLLSISQSIARLLALLLLFYLGFRHFGGILSYFIANLIGIVYGFTVIRRLFPPRKSVSLPQMAPPKKQYLHFFLSNLGITLLITTDILAVKFFLDDFQTGIYSAVTMLGKIIFFASGSILVVTYPLFLRYKNKPQKQASTFILTASIMLLVNLAISLVYYLFPTTIINLVFNQNYQSLRTHLPLYSLLTIFYSLLFLVNQFFLSRRSPFAVYLTFIPSLIQIAVIIFYHQDINQILTASTLIISCAALCGLLAVYLHIRSSFRLRMLSLSHLKSS